MSDDTGKAATCEVCHGTGEAHAGYAVSVDGRCPECSGTGKVRRVAAAADTPDLEAIRKRAEDAAYLHMDSVNCTLLVKENVPALLAHIATLTAQRDECEKQYQQQVEQVGHEINLRQQAEAQRDAAVEALGSLLAACDGSPGASATADAVIAARAALAKGQPR